jgi:hypothetical protein
MVLPRLPPCAERVPRLEPLGEVPNTAADRGVKGRLLHLMKPHPAGELPNTAVARGGGAGLRGRASQFMNEARPLRELPFAVIRP